MQKTLLLAVCSLLLLTGCRTYGGYGSEDATISQIGKAVESATDLLRQAEADAAMLSSAATSSNALSALSGEFGRLVEQNSEIVERAQGMLDSYLAEGSTYRGLSRGLGAIISEIDEVQIGYARVTEAVAEITGGAVSASTAGRIGSDSRYRVAPPAYARGMRMPISMRDALDG